MSAKPYRLILISAFHLLCFGCLTFSLGACKGSDTDPQQSSDSTRYFPSPMDPNAVAAFKASFAANESEKPRFHTLSTSFTGDQKIGQIFVGCNLDGKSERICLLDTGAAFSSVPGKYEAPSPTPSPSPSVSTSPLETFIAAGHSFGEIFMYRLSPDGYPVDLASGTISGIIGEDLLRSGGLNLDFKNSEVHFDRIESADALPYSFVLNSIPEIELPIRLNGESATAIFDTGASTTAVDSNWIDQHSEQFENIGEITTRNFSGEQAVTKIYRAKTIQVGEVEFHSLVVMALDFSKTNWVGSNAKVVLGYNVISQGQWKIDYPTLKWSFKAY